MKTITNKKVVEVEEFEQIYECDSCGFQAKYSYDVAEHEFWYGIYVYEEPATYYNSYYEDDQATIRSIDWFIEMWNNRVEDANHSLSDAYKLLEQHDDH